MSRPKLMNRGGGQPTKVVFDGYDFGLKMPFVDGSNRLFLARGGHFLRLNGHPYAKYWRVPKGKLLEDLEVLHRDFHDVAGGAFNEDWATFSRKVYAAQENVIRDAFIWGMRLRLAPLSGGGVLLSGDYHPGSVAVSKRMQGAFLNTSRSWRIPGSAELVRSNLILELGMAEDQFDILDTLQDLLSDGTIKPSSDVTRMQLGGNPPDAIKKSESEGESDVYLASVPSIRSTELSADFIDKALLEYSLMDHQPAGIRHLLLRTSALLADDMGLGKTRQAIIAAGIRAQGKMILVIVLTSLIINWEREIQMVYPDARIAQQKFDPDAQWMIVNYERLGDFVPIANNFEVMIVDEAHRLKEPTTAWTRHGFDIAAKVPNRYLLTGTPVLNRESELHTLLRLSGHPIGLLSLKEFCEQFAGSPEFRQALREQISDWMLRRRKDVLPNLKGKQKQTVPVELSEDQRKEYAEILRSDRHTFARLGSLRQLLERVKIPVVADLAAELDVEDKAILFCEHKETVFALQEHFTSQGIECVTLVGSDSPKKRQKAIDQFQQDPDVRFFIGTTSAAGTGYNLTAANYVFFLGLPWTPGLQDQAEDRAYRNGQQRMVIVKIPLVENSIDQQLWQMLMDKRALASDLIEPDPVAASKAALCSTLGMV